MSNFILLHVQQAPVYGLSLESTPFTRSISDDDCCAWCRHLLYRPGELSLCQLHNMHDWPACFNEDGYALDCEQQLACR
ncbi:hypothetical protein WFK93_21360 [Yersinia enterocolitica]